MTLDKMIEELGEKRVENLEQDFLEHDEDVGYYDES